ncbi:MAG: hypothetical protein NUV73_02845, partial [Candidatus Daviesbacteria bacterium]|nr:hypothetical protein [Candidatus Daviesbacteria bacterium]
MASVVLGVFSERDKAEDAIAELEAKDFNPKDMSIMMKDTGEAHSLAEDKGGEVIVATLGGATTGAVIGGIAGLVASFAIPGLGVLFIGGPIAAALGLTGAAATTASGAATGALAGGLLGALGSTFGLTNEEARVYEKRINDGGILVAVPTPEGEEEKARKIMSAFEADNLKVVKTS